MHDAGTAIVFRSRLGWAAIVLRGSAISRVVLPRNSRKSMERELGQMGKMGAHGSKRTDRGTDRIISLFQRYFAGRNGSPDLPIDLHGHTKFRKDVWRAARTIPYGETRSYGWIARKIGKPLAARAVGQAMGANPVPILVP